MESIEFLERVKKLAIIAMFSDDELMDQLVLKGGNLLDIVYRISTRASVDLDFSIEGEFDEIKSVGERIEYTLRRTFGEAGYVAFDIRITEVPKHMSDDVRGFWGGYRVEFKIIERGRYDRFKDDLNSLRRNAASVGKRGSTKFSLEISKHEYCVSKRPQELDGYRIYAYSPEMFVCEKLRSICQQMPQYAEKVRCHPSARARDFVDIHTIVENFDIDFGSRDFHQLMRNVFATKRVPLRLIQRIGDFKDFHRQDFAEVQATTKRGVQLEDFDFYFEYVLDQCLALEPLWNE